MSLNQKYTWADFLSQNPDFKGKRTTPEGKKAFEAATKKFLKEYLKDREADEVKSLEKVKADREKLSTTLKATKKSATPKLIQKKVGSKDYVIARLGRAIERTKQLQKTV